MDKFRAFIRWMMINPEDSGIAQAQYDELKSQIPSLYALLMVNAIAVSYTHYDVAPAYLTVGILSAMLLVTGLRMVAWIRVRNKVLSPGEAIKKMRRIVVFGCLIAVVYISWSLSLDAYGGPAERGHVALFIAITVIGCIFCLMHLPQAALMVLIIVTLPFLYYYIGQRQDVYIAMAMNIFLVCIVITRVLLNGYQGFCKLIRSQAALAAKQRETERLNEENERLAQTDALTGLPNRRYFFNKLEKLIDEVKDTDKVFAVGVVDLDRFKPINDTYGHQLGDHLLKEVGSRLETLSQPHIDICRLGGDEFGFLYRGNLEDAAQTGRTICKAISEPCRIGDLQMTVGASCGIAFYPEAGTTAHTLFDRSDYALYNSKTTTRGRTTVYSAEHEARIRSERAIEIALQGADLDSEFQVHFQPIVSLPEHTIVGFEALARWHSPTLDKVTPDKFIPIAERTGLIHRLTLALFEKALGQIMSLPGELCLSFNLSAQDITSAETVDALLEIIRKHGTNPRQITFEITETSVIGSYETAESCLKTLRKAGVNLALDDFGTGYSSLGYLHRLPIDSVKIDRSFVADLHDPVAKGVVTSIIGLCRSMEILCVVEGVEEQHQLDVLNALHCRLAQGYHFAAPMPFDEILQSVQGTGKVAGLCISNTAGIEELNTALG